MIGLLAAVVLAGGESRRLGGGDKVLLDLNGVPLISRILSALRRETSLIAINANGDPARFGSFGLPVLSDGRFAGEGPLAGVAAGLAWAEATGAGTLLTVPGDTPLIPAGLAAALAPAPGCAGSLGRAHHLVALWPVACRSELEGLLTSPGKRAVARFTAMIGMRVVDFPAHACDPFMNINTPEDLAQARQWVRGEQ